MYVQCLAGMHAAETAGAREQQVPGQAGARRVQGGAAVRLGRVFVNQERQRMLRMAKQQEKLPLKPAVNEITWTCMSILRFCDS